MRASTYMPLAARRAALALTMIGALGACDDPVASRDARWTGERTLVTASGTRLQARVDRSGGAAGSPTIVLVSGLDAPLEVWTAVRGALASDAPVFSYDRGGVGRSGGVTGARPSSVVAAELREVLRAGGLRPPYLLVAHSLGGAHARVFADRYPADVAGLVLVDATPDLMLGALQPSDLADVAATLRHDGAKAEVLAQLETASEASRARLPDVPLVVLSSLRAEDGVPLEAKQFLADLQALWLAQVTRGEQLRIDAGHDIPREAPEAVVAATRRVLALAAR